MKTTTKKQLKWKTGVRERKSTNAMKKRRKTATKSGAKKDTHTHRHTSGRRKNSAGQEEANKKANTFITVVSFLFEIYYICNFSMLMHTNVVWLLHLFIRLAHYVNGSLASLRSASI